MDTEGLSIICAGIGLQEEDENGAIIGYTPSECCLDNLKDLQRFLRRDDPNRREVFKQICKWRTVAQDLVPIIEYHQTDRNLVINAVKILVFMTMPIDPASDDVAQQIEHLWELKAAMARNVMIAVVVSLLEEPLEHLEGGSFTEDDWKLVQLLLTLFRNILAIQGITLQQKSSGSATQFLYLADRYLELMFQENVMDLILVLTQHVDDPCGYLHEDNLLLLEIFHYIFQGRDAALIAGVSRKGSKAGDITTSVESLRSIMEEEEEKRRLIQQRNLERHSQFSGTFARLGMDGSKALFKGNPASASADALLKVHKVPRGRLKRIAWDSGSLLLPKENILELLYNFLNQFLSGGYNVLMQSILDDIKKEHQYIRNADVIIFFQVAQFATAYQHQKILVMQKLNVDGTTSEVPVDVDLGNGSSSDVDLCGPVAATISESMFDLVVSKWREIFEGLKETNDHKFLSASGSLMKNMIRMLDLVLKTSPEDRKGTQTARILLYKMFYDQTDQGLTQFLFNLFRSFDTHKQPKSDLADLLEIIHVVFRLMENLQERGTLRVSRKSRRGRRKGTKVVSEVESEKLRGEHATSKNVDDQIKKSEKTTVPSLDPNNIKESTLETSFVEKEGTPPINNSVEPDMLLEDTECQKDDSFIMGGATVDNNHDELTYDTDDYSDHEQLPATNEVDFNVSKLVSSFANNTVIKNLCWMLKYYKSNSVSINHYIICMLRRFCDDLELSPMLYQLSLLTTFYDILADQKTSKSKEYANIVHFLTNFVRKMMKIMKSQPLLFVDILFWKTRKECRYINAEALMCDLVQLKQDVKSMNSEEAGLSNYKGQSSYKSIADSLGDDEIDYVLPHILNNQREESSSDIVHQEARNKARQTGYEQNNTAANLNEEMDPDESESVPADLRSQKTLKRKKGRIFDEEQETAIKHLYEKYKDNRCCSRLIAEALDPDGNISPIQISCKLKQFGLKVSSRRKSSGSSIPAEDNAAGVHDTIARDVIPNNPNELDENSSLKTSSRTRKRVRAFSKEKELEVRALFERFKHHEKCSYMIANALDADNAFTAAQVSRKLRQLGLLDPQMKKSSKYEKHSEGRNKKETINEDQSDEETLLAMKERTTKKKSKPPTIRSICQHQLTHDSDDETLSSVFKDVLRQHHKPLHKDGHGTVDSLALDDTKETQMDITSNKEDDGDTAILHQQEQKTPDEIMADLEDSGDDLGAMVPRYSGSRRNLKMVIDAEDDE